MLLVESSGKLSRFALRCLVIGIASAIFTHPMIAQDSPVAGDPFDGQVADQRKEDESVRNATASPAALLNSKLRQLYLESAHGLKVVSDDSEPISLVPKTVFTWTSSGDWSGDVFAWANGETIQIVGCIGSYRLDDQSRQLFYEFHSFANVSLRDVDFDGRFVWRVPMRSGSLDAIRVANSRRSTPAAQLIRMRQHANAIEIGMQVTDDEVERELRLLPQPLTRMTNTSSSLHTALFGWVSSSGTDPEAMLLIQAEQADDGLTWQFTPARFTTRELWMSRDGHEVWRADAITRWSNDLLVSDPYFYRTGAVLMNSELPDVGNENP